MDASTLISFISGLAGVFVGALLSGVGYFYSRRRKKHAITKILLAEIEINAIRLHSFHKHMVRQGDDWNPMYEIYNGLPRPFGTSTFRSQLENIGDLFSIEATGQIYGFYAMLESLNEISSYVIQKMDSVRELDANDKTRNEVLFRVSGYGRSWQSLIEGIATETEKTFKVLDGDASEYVEWFKAETKKNELLQQGAQTKN